MNRRFTTAWRPHQVLSARGIPSVIIGGLAVQRWGQPRSTRGRRRRRPAPAGAEAPALRELVAAVPSRVPDALAVALEHRALPLLVPEGREVDVSLGLPDPAIVERVERAWRACGPGG